jgi:hypothetical protein
MPYRLIPFRAPGDSTGLEWYFVHRVWLCTLMQNIADTKTVQMNALISLMAASSLFSEPVCPPLEATEILS